VCVTNACNELSVVVISESCSCQSVGDVSRRRLYVETFYVTQTAVSLTLGQMIVCLRWWWLIVRVTCWRSNLTWCVSLYTLCCYCVLSLCK